MAFWGVLCRPRLLLTKLGLRFFRRFRGLGFQRFVRSRFRLWCVEDDLPVCTNAGFTMAVSPRNYMGYGVYFFGEYDPSMTGVIRHLVREGQRAWDVGAEGGWFTLLLAHCVGPTGRVDAFEPYAPNASRLRKNITLNEFNWARVCEAAVGASAGHASLMPPPPPNKGWAGLEKYHSGVGYISNGQDGSSRVPVVTLDEYAEQTNLESLAFMKLDVEGSEVAALQGATRCLTRFRPVIAVEYNALTLRRAGTSIDELDRILDEYGYDRFMFHGRWVRLERSYWANLKDGEAIFNVYGFPRHQRG